jgi:hypothetical protein
MPFENGLTVLEAIFTVSEDATADPVSPLTEDFSDPVTITVTAEDNTEQIWTITVTEEPDPNA